MLFEDLDLPEQICKACYEQGWDNPSPIQAIVIPQALAGKDILGAAPTGTGKSGAFLLPAIARLSLDKKDLNTVRMIVLEPTRELALQVESVAKKLCADLNISVSSITGGATRDDQREKLGNIVIATVGRLLEFLKKQWLSVDDIEILVIDEADRMLDMGFRDDVAKITRQLSYRYQTMLFSATLDTYAIDEFASLVLNDPFEVRLGSGDSDDEKLPELLSSRAYYAANELQKLKILSHLLTTNQEKSIVFVRTKDKVAELAAKIRFLKREVSTLQGDNAQSLRNAAMRRFIDSKDGILIATDVAARGLDVKDVVFVYNFDLPHNSTIYIHRAGRTARASQKGTVVSLVLKEDILYLERIERYTKKEIQRRAIKNLCAAFPLDDSKKTNVIKKETRASLGGKGGFDRKKKNKDEKATRKKDRHRDRKNIGKPDFAEKRRKKMQRQQLASKE